MEPCAVELLGSVLVYVVVLVVAARLLPDRVPLHFDGAGTPDDVGSRAEARDLWAIATATMLLLSGVCLLTVRAARSAEPGLDGWFGVVLGLYLVYVLLWTVRVVRGHRPEG